MVIEKIAASVRILSKPCLRVQACKPYPNLERWSPGRGRRRGACVDLCPWGPSFLAGMTGPNRNVQTGDGTRCTALASVLFCVSRNDAPNSCLNNRDPEHLPLRREHSPRYSSQLTRYSLAQGLRWWRDHRRRTVQNTSNLIVSLPIN